MKVCKTFIRRFGSDPRFQDFPRETKTRFAVMVAVPVMVVFAPA
jgi:hypothetical protein